MTGRRAADDLDASAVGFPTFRFLTPSWVRTSAPRHAEARVRKCAVTNVHARPAPTCITGNTVRLMDTVSVRELRNNGGAVLAKVARGEAVIVTRDGAEVAELHPRRRPGLAAAELVARRRSLPGGRSRAAPAGPGRRGRSDVMTTRGLLGHLDARPLGQHRGCGSAARRAVDLHHHPRRAVGGPLVATTSDERAARQSHLQQAEADFEPLGFDAAAARALGRVAASLRHNLTQARGSRPRRDDRTRRRVAGPGRLHLQPGRLPGDRRSRRARGRAPG